MAHGMTSPAPQDEQVMNWLIRLKELREKEIHDKQLARKFTWRHGSSMVVSVVFAYGSSLWMIPPNAMQELEICLSKDSK